MVIIHGAIFHCAPTGRIVITTMIVPDLAQYALTILRNPPFSTFWILFRGDDIIQTPVMAHGLTANFTLGGKNSQLLYWKSSEARKM